MNLHTGDVILRQGKGFISEVFRKSSLHDQHYSHAGVIQVTAKGVFVVHVIGNSGKADSELKSEPIDEFCKSSENRSYAIYRYSFLSGKEHEINRYLNNLKSQHIRFDEHFDMSTKNLLYCTELVYDMCLMTVNHPLPVTEVRGRQYVGLDDLYLNEASLLITKQTY